MRIRLLAAAAVVALSTAALAERHPEHTITLGYQTEHSELVAIALPGPTEVDMEAGTSTAAFALETVLRGDVATGAHVTVHHAHHGHGPGWTQGKPHLVFLRHVPADDGTGWYESVSCAYGFRPLVEGEPSARFPGIVRDLAATLDAEGRVTQPDALRTLLVRLAGDADDGIAAAAALDLARHREFHGALTADDRSALLESFRARSPGRARRQIAQAVAVVRAPGAARALVDAVLEPGSERDRTGIAEALRILRDATAESRAIERLEQADALQRRSLLAVLRAIGGTASVAPVRSLLTAPEPETRAAAAHTLGEVARNIHRAEPEADVAGRDELAQLISRATTRNEWKAGLWALAQIDDPRAFDVLRRLAADADAPVDVRKLAARLLERPRVALILD